MTDLKACTILLVDDVKDNINVLVQALRGEYKLGFALDGENALAFARSKRPDLILLDVMMPGLDGLEVCRRLKRDPRTRDIPVLFITAKDEVEDKAAGFEAGGVDYLTKPFEMLELKARVKTHLSLRLAQREIQRQRDHMQYSLNLAMEVQQNLMPKTDPNWPGLDVSGRIIYCDETGGDYYDYIVADPPGSGKYAVAVGDASDHGVQSALLMTTARAFLRQRYHMPGGLDQVAADVNRQFARDVKDSGRFMTLFLCELDTAAGRINWVRAGHDPGWLYDTATQKFTLLDGRGLPLGVLGECEYQASSTELTPGQIVVLGTDGLWETRNPDGDFLGKRRLMDVVARTADQPAANIAQTLLDEVALFRGPTPPGDDVTVVAIKVDRL
jgi:serine phosphatase RsbU (regulator of sigma subunit)